MDEKQPHQGFGHSADGGGLFTGKEHLQRVADEGLPTLGNLELLRVGSSGPRVKELQELLNEADASPPLVADGIFGNLTREQVVNFQSSRGLVPDGLAGPRTMGLLQGGDAPEATLPVDELLAPVSTGSFSALDAQDPKNNCNYKAGEREDSHNLIGPVLPPIRFGTPVDKGAVVQQFIFSNFGSGDFALKGAEHLGSLKPLIQAFGLDSLKPTHRVQLLEGYTDCVSDANVNVPLRLNRARNLKLALMTNGAKGVNMSDPIAGQFGTEPATNRTPSGRALNRSVRLVIERIGKPPRQPNPQFGCQFDDPCECPSDEWELIGVGGFEFVIGLGIFVAHFVLRNVKQRCCYSLNFQSFQASGVGAGISLDDFVFGSPTRFTTAPTVSIANFRDTRATVETIGAGFGVGFEEATIDFTQIRTTAEKIDIGGFTLGKFEVGGSAINAPGSVTIFNARRCG